MFASGVVKLTSRCPTWWGLTGVHLFSLWVRQALSVFSVHLFLSTMLDSGDLPLRDSVHPHSAGLVCPPVAVVVAEAECGRDLRH